MPAPNPKLVELTDNRFVYRCDACGKEWEVMTKEQAFTTTAPMHTCPKGPKPREDAGQGAT
jgi:hypothetical protein